jgi:hypothetical protein
MPTWLKIVLIVVGIFLLLGIGAIVAGVVWYQQSGKQMIQGAVQAVQDGQKYGRSADNKACVSEGVKRFKTDKSLTGTMVAKGFVTGCLQTSESTPSFCDNVPSQFDFSDAARWETDQCHDNGLSGEPNCPQVFAAVVEHCAKKK